MIINVFSVFKYPLFSSDLMKYEFSRQIFAKYRDIKFHDNPSNGSRDSPCGRTDGQRHDEANRRFSKILRTSLKAQAIKIPPLKHNGMKSKKSRQVNLFTYIKQVVFISKLDFVPTSPLKLLLISTGLPSPQITPNT